MAIVLWVGFRASKSVRKTAADLEGVTETPTEPRHTAFDSLFEESESDYAQSSFPQEEASMGYFSYETMAEPVLTPAPKTATPKAPKKERKAVEAEQEQQGFDLRQAVIYQTILTNKYLDEVQHYEN